MKKVVLNNGVNMPILGVGVYQIPDREECKRCVLDAIDVGYRSIDTATSYQNEEAVGDAIQESGIDREDIFVTSKLWIADTGYEKTRKSVEASLNKLKTPGMLCVRQPSMVIIVRRPDGELLPGPFQKARRKIACILMYGCPLG